MKHIPFLFLFVFAAAGAIAQPTDNAADPAARNAEDVISIYGDTYSTLEGVNYNPDWGQSGHGQVNPAYDPGTGKTVLAYPNFNYQGTEFTAQSAASMEFLHVDIWVASGTDRTVKVSPIDDSGNGPREVLVEVALTPGSWNSVDIPIGDFTGMSWQSVFQLKFDGQFNGDGSANTTPFDVYLDNIYFWKEAANATTDATLSDLQVDGATISGFDPAVTTYTYGLVEGTTTVPQITDVTTTNNNATTSITQASSVPGSATVLVKSEDGTTTETYTVNYAITIPATAAPVPPEREASQVVSIFSDAYTDIQVGTFSADFDDSDIEDVTIAGNAAKKITFTNFIGIDFQNDRQDLTNMTHFHMDFWTGETDLTGKVFNLKFSDWAGGDAEASVFELPINTGTTPAIVTGDWVSIDVPISDFTNTPENRSDVAQFIITSNLREVYVDNIYFHTNTITSNDLIDQVPNKFTLEQNYPNPFNPSTNISYSIPVSGEVSLEVFNLQGQKVMTLFEGYQTAGSHDAVFNAANLASGVYIYQLTSGNTNIVKKMMLIK